jgi:hypothetical protein
MGSKNYVVVCFIVLILTINKGKIMAGASITDTTIQQLSYGMDDGVTVAISGGKLGFYGLAAPIAKRTLTVCATVTAQSTTTVANNAIAECYAALAAYGLVT